MALPALILRGSPGDLAGSVLLQINGLSRRPDDAFVLAAALDGDAIVAALIGAHPGDSERVAAARVGSPASPGAGMARRLPIWLAQKPGL